VIGDEEAESGDGARSFFPGVSMYLGINVIYDSFEISSEVSMAV
jgi:hypothetical protein